MTYTPKLETRPVTCTKCKGDGQIQVFHGTDIHYEPCPKCGGDGYLLIKKELR